jgi:hypothetical protein
VVATLHAHLALALKVLPHYRRDSVVVSMPFEVARGSASRLAGSSDGNGVDRAAGCADDRERRHHEQALVALVVRHRF